MNTDAATAEKAKATRQFAVTGWSVTVLRVSLAGIFIVSGLVHILATDQVADRLTAARFGGLVSGLGDPSRIALLSGVALLIGGAALASGWLTRWAATGLIAALIPITVTIQLGGGILSGPLWKNIALFGGLIFFATNDVAGHRLPAPRNRKKSL